jgi:outer membrane immunogenic protein
MRSKIVSLLAVAVSLGFTQAASAADMPVKAPVQAAPVAPPVYNWSGVYVGIHGGFGWGRESDTDNIAVGLPTGSGTSFNPSGGIFGGQLGYRWQWNQLVLGVEGTGAWANLTQDVLKGSATEFATLKIKSLYTVTGQAGWAMNQWLFYVKGGWAGAHSEQDLNFPGVATASNSQSNSGWTVGGGIDYAVWQNLILGVEYDHFDLGYSNFTTPVSNGGAPFAVFNSSRLTADQIVGRISYKFWTP